MEEKRKQIRVDVVIPVIYSGYHDDGNSIGPYKGNILDISLGGALIESETILNAKRIKLVFVNYKNEEFSVAGFVIYSKKDNKGTARTGIRFDDGDDKIYNIVTNIVRTYHYKKKHSPPDI